MMKSDVKVKSVGMKVSITIALLLLVILGSKTIYDSTTSYNLAVKNSEDFEREETRAFAGNAEGKFKKAYETGAALIAAIQAEMESNSEAERNRESITRLVTQIDLTNPDLAGVGVILLLEMIIKQELW